MINVKFWLTKKHLQRNIVQAALSIVDTKHRNELESPGASWGEMELANTSNRMSDGS